MELIKRFLKVFFWAISNFKDFAFGIENAMYAKRGREYSQSWKYCNAEVQPGNGTKHKNQLRAYFDANTEGNGIFKVLHYFEIYERHFKKFVGKEVHIAEVGVYSGGSLKMWKSYFGDKCKIYGIDIIEECKSYADENTTIFIGDQESRIFWQHFKKSVPRIDIFIDDGGHLAEQQIVTLEEILPFISPGGVYLCEDVSGSRLKLTAYMNGIQNELNHIEPHLADSVDLKTTPFQQQVYSIHQYPYVFVIEKQSEPINEFSAVKMGTIWNPILPER
ncbi:MAG: class I SAM-dependent methyltransferase [Pyrinomonadaceae bacterium]